MFGSLGRRAVESVVALFALLGFACVPLGSKTGLEHTLALFRTESAREAGAGLLAALARARALLFEAAASSVPGGTRLPNTAGSAQELPRSQPPRLAAAAPLAEPRECFAPLLSTPSAPPFQAAPLPSAAAPR